MFADRRPRTLPSRVLLVLSATLVVLPLKTIQARPAALRPLGQQEQTELLNAIDTQRRFTMKLNRRTYLGGLSYQLSDFSCDMIWQLLDDPVSHYARALPATKSVELAEPDNPTKLVVTHGNSLINGSYTADVRIDEGRQIARFWLDHSRPKDVQDVFGYIKLTPFQQRCLITAAVAVDPGQGLLASLFRGMIHSYLVKAAARIGSYAKRQLANRFTDYSARI